jgi:peptide chain release factor 2
MTIHLNKKDFIIQPYRSSGPGGQHKNTTDSAIRITHIESGIVAQADNNRCQHKNKELAFERIVVKLQKYYEEKQRGKEAVELEKENNVIRSYNGKRGTVKDHRTGTTLPMKSVLNGGIAKFIQDNLIQDLENE